MKKFLVRGTLFLFIPLSLFVVLSVLYFYRDPYSDFGKYDNYSWKYGFQMLGDISTKKLLHSKTKYNSFIFGSSRTTSLYACYLQKKIKNSRFFHYANWNEPIGGVYAKLKLLDSLGYDIDNVIIYLDTDNSFMGNGDGTNDHYLLYPTTHYQYLVSHYSYILSHFDKDKLRLLLGLNNGLFVGYDADPVTNDFRHRCTDSSLKTYGDSIFTKDYLRKIDSLTKIGFYYARSVVQQYKLDQISGHEIDILNKIKLLLLKHKASYYVVCTPLYDQYKFSEADFEILHSAFETHLYDFTGINSITKNAYNYPDGRHFKDYISKEIIDSIVKF